MQTTSQVEIIRKKEFAMAALVVGNKIFVVHVIALAELIILLIYLSRKVLIALLINTEILIKYSNFLDVFSSNFALELPKHTAINDYLIDLLKDKKPPYDLIYSLGLVELKMLKTYIKAKLASNFIRSFKFLVNALILFIRKRNSSLYLYIDY